MKSKSTKDEKKTPAVEVELPTEDLEKVVGAGGVFLDIQSAKGKKPLLATFGQDSRFIQ